MVGLPVLTAQNPQARVQVSPEDHDRGGALVPALAHVRAVGFLADGVERQAVEQPSHLLVRLARRYSGLDPVGVAARGGRAVGCGFDRFRRPWRWSAGGCASGGRSVESHGRSAV